MAPACAFACLFVLLVTGAAADAEAPATGAQVAAQRPAPSVRRAGLLPPAVVLFEDRDGGGVEPRPNAEGSAAAAETLRAAFVAEMADRGIELTVIGKDEIGLVDSSRLFDVPRRIARDDPRPFPEAALSAAYPQGSVESVMQRHRLDAVWIVTGIAILSTGRAEAAAPAGSPIEAPALGKRLLLRAALVDVKGTVLFSDLVDRAATAKGGGMPGAPEEIIPATVDLRDPQVARQQAKALLAEYRTEEDRRETARAAARAKEARAAAPRSPHPAEFRLGVGVFFFAPDGVDLWAGWLSKNSRWQFGYRYVRWRDDFEDPFTGNELTKTTETMQGPQVNYLFHPEKRGTWYVGASLLRWSRTEAATMNGVSDSDSVVAPFLGGGYTRHLSKHVYFNTAMFLGLGAQLETNTGVSSEETSGGFDIQLQIGASF